MKLGEVQKSWVKCIEIGWIGCDSTRISQTDLNCMKFGEIELDWFDIGMKLVIFKELWSDPIKLGEIK